MLIVQIIFGLAIASILGLLVQDVYLTVKEYFNTKNRD